MSIPDPADHTADSAAPTDIAPLGRGGPKPAHERTAGEDGDPFDWDLVANDPGFAALKAAKRRFILPATIFFFFYYMSLPVLVGFCPDLMKTALWGKVNIAYLFALSQFLMTWALCALYVRAARRWDVMNEELLARLVRR